MLPTADAGVVRRERDLPGVGFVLDPEALVERLNTIFVEAGVESARIRNVQYAPGTSCTALYEVNTGGTPFRLYAKAYRHEDLQRLKSPRIRKAAPGIFGPGRVLLNAPAVVLYFFPNDHLLRKLFQLFEEAPGNVFPEHCSGTGTRLHTVDYLPERRYAGTVMTDEKPRAVVKVYGAGLLERAIQSSTVFVDRSVLRVEPVLGVSPPYGAVLFGWTEGKRLQLRIDEGSVKRSEIALAVQALDELHKQTDHGHYFWNFAGELATVAEVVRRLCPSLADKALHIASRLLERLESSQIFVPVHGSWTPENIQTGKKKVTFLNLEGAALAPPALDPGTFLAYLERQVIYGSLSARQAATLSEMLIRECSSICGIEPADCDFFAAYALFRNLAEPFSLRHSEWNDKMEMMLNRADQLMGTKAAGFSTAAEQGSINLFLKSALGRVASRLKGVRVTDPYGVCADPAMPFLDNALNPEEVSRRLPVAFPEILREHKLSQIRVTSYRPGKRCGVEYEWSSAAQIVILHGTAEAEPDHSVLQAQKELWAGAFSPGNEDGITVARPVGRIPEFQMRLEFHVGGTPISEVLPGQDGQALAHKLALALHKLHHSNLDVTRTHTLENELNLLRDHLTSTARIRPPWAARLERILEACQQLVSATPEPQSCVIHRNFCPDKILLSGNTLFLLNLDSLSSGNPALDVGTMLGSLKEIALCAFGDADALLGCEESFRETYLELSGMPLRQPVKTFTTLNLAHQIYTSTLSAEQSLITGDLIELCEKRLDIVSKTAAPSTRAVFKVR